MPPSHYRAPYGLFAGCSRVVLNKIRTSPHGTRTAPYTFYLPVWRPWSYNAWIISLRVPCGLMPQSHHTPGSPTVPDCSGAVLNKHRTSTHGARTGPVRRRANFAYPYGAQTVLEIVNSTWSARAGTVRGQYGPRTAKHDACVGFLPNLVVSIPVRVCKGAARHPYGWRTGPVWVP